MPATVTLYHYTCIEHLPTILAAGYLKTSESNISPRVPHAGPDVAWLTTQPDPTLGHGLNAGQTVVDKTRIRFTVQVPKRAVTPWRLWATMQGIDPTWMRALAQAGGSGTWRVTPRPIPAEQWVEVLDRHTGRTYPIPTT